MPSFWDQFSTRYESIHDSYLTPSWFRANAPVSRIPGVERIEDDLWRANDQLYVCGATEAWDRSKKTYVTHSEPVIVFLYVASGPASVFWHRQRSTLRPELPPIAGSCLGGYIPAYGELCKRFQCSESAIYHGTLGHFIEKKVQVDVACFCFQALNDDERELPYLIEISDPIGITKNTQPGATDNPDDAQRLREDH